MQNYNIYNFLTHYNWLSTAAYKGYDPSYVNQQIIHTDGYPLVYHKEICYYPHNGDYNCTTDLLGPVYPGQMLQVDLCIPYADRN